MPLKNRVLKARTLHHKFRICAAVSLLLYPMQFPANAQFYDPKSQSPLKRVATPTDPVAYRDARVRAQALLHQKKAAEAEPLAEQITREYPRDGENWFLLAEVKGSLNKHSESAAAYGRAGELLRWGSSEDLAFEVAVEYLRA